MAPQEPTILKLSPELLEGVLQAMDVESMKNLRLTCKSLSERCVGPSFKRFLELQSTDLSEHGLRSLSSLASHPFGKSVRTLRIVVTIYDTSQVEALLKTTHHPEAPGTDDIGISLDGLEDDLFKARADLAWLHARQREQEEATEGPLVSSLAGAMAKFSSLRSVELDTVLMKSPNAVVSLQGQRRTIPEWVAPLAYRVAISAIIMSGVSVEALAGYRGVPKFSISARDIAAYARVLQADKLAIAGRSIRSLTLSIALLPGSATPGVLADEDAREVCNFMMTMPNLEEVEIHIYDAARGGSGAQLSGRLFREVATRVHFTSLQRCTLRGIAATEESMLQFLDNHSSIAHLELNEVCLLSGTWTPIFAQISVLPSLTRLGMSTLWGVRRLENLRPFFKCSAWNENHWDWSYPCLGGGLMVHTLRLEEDDLNTTRESGEGLRFRPGPSGRPMGSVRCSRWLQSSRAWYG